MHVRASAPRAKETPWGMIFFFGLVLLIVLIALAK
jgi:hypothetical protein